MQVTVDVPKGPSPGGTGFGFAVTVPADLPGVPAELPAGFAVASADAELLLESDAGMCFRLQPAKNNTATRT